MNTSESHTGPHAPLPGQQAEAAAAVPDPTEAAATATPSLEARIDALESKIDLVLDDLREQQRRRREMEALKDDLMIIGRDLYQTAVVELDSIHDSFRTVDLLHLGKKLLRNVDVITQTIEKLESVKDFVEDAGPLARDAFRSLLQTLDDLDRQGTFALLRDTRVAVNAARSAPEPSLVEIVRQLRSPEARRGMAMLLAVLRQIGTPSPHPDSNPTTDTRHIP
jgi:hypothetical protein